MSTGLIALLDDVVSLTKLAAASLDDAAGQAARASAKAAGVVIDDAAVTPRYVTGFAAARELPIVGRIALGSLKNKLLYLLPAGIALNYLAPFTITPLLMLGGAYLCYEGAEKVLEALFHGHEGKAAHGAEQAGAAADASRLEEERVRGAIRTDLILSAEIMAITLATVAEATVWTQIFVLVLVGIGITFLVYGGVALIVKADDAGLAMTQSERLGPFLRAVGRGLVRGMPVFLRLLGVVGTAAMLWVGGGIILHGLEHYGVTAPAHVVHDLAEAAAVGPPALAASLAWAVGALGAGLLGLIVGGVIAVVVQQVAAPVLARLRA